MKRILFFAALALMTTAVMAADFTDQFTTSSIDCGESVTVTATPQAKYHFDRWQVVTDGVAPKDTLVGTATLTVDPLKSDREFNALFLPNAKVTVVVDKGTVTQTQVVSVAYMTENSNNVTEFTVDVQGDDVPMYAQTNDECYTFQGWRVGTSATLEPGTLTGSINTFTLTDVTEDVTVTAVYAVKTFKVKVNYNAAEGSVAQQ